MTQQIRGHFNEILNPEIPIVWDSAQETVQPTPAPAEKQERKWFHIPDDKGSASKPFEYKRPTPKPVDRDKVYFRIPTEDK